MELIHLCKASSPTVSSAPQLDLTVQGLQSQPVIQDQSGPEYLLSSSSESSGEREKRESGPENGGGGGGQQGQGGLTLSVTANFHALQQKLLRELWLRNSRVMSTIINYNELK